ncbi:hypothetical protein QVD17_27770 [Tagetes erecta]|uniref:RING-type E3 ubiquitin transferase n=1 Tax=Tagetes erecta TaxID=13708 RepID=A0AAD8K943_TARER|nr:hypothetical protein QVD17_27770 [Tagetes erecta]
MGDSLNLPKPSTQLLSSSSPQPHRSNMPILYYGLVVVATAAIVLAIYNLIVVKWCATQYRRSLETNHLSQRARNNNMIMSSALSRGSSSTIGLTSSFRYKGRIEDANKTSQMDYDIECSVCLSVFEEGEEVRKLPRCNHLFHASCIDMWLYSHFDCPLCRAPVVEALPLSPPVEPTQYPHTDSVLTEHSRDGLLDRASSST